MIGIQSTITLRMFIGLLVCVSLQLSIVEADFDFSAHFIAYRNPSHRCAECLPDSIQACCSDSRMETFMDRTTCDGACNNRFHFFLRPFKAPVITGLVPPGGRPNPFNDVVTFETSDTAIHNQPNPRITTNISQWMGNIQFYVVPYLFVSSMGRRRLAIDRFYIDLDDLTLGASFTQTTTYNGTHGIAQLDMRFQVDCSENYFGPDCTTFCEGVQDQYNCDNDGNIACVQENRDPATNCAMCLIPELDPATNCALCLMPKLDPATNCALCLLPQLDPGTNCDECLVAGQDPATNCATCLPGLDPATDCFHCLEGLDPFTNCTVAGKFRFTVLFHEYWNPSHLCGECRDDGPVCCDQESRTTDCPSDCGVRLNYFLQEYGAPDPSLPIRRLASPIESDHVTFNESQDAFNNRPNPITVGLSTWTGQIQFYLVVFDFYHLGFHDPRNRNAAVDRFLINLDLNLGAELTPPTRYSGIYKISEISLSFQVACSENYFGPDCTTFCEGVEGQYNCDSDGNIVCVQGNRDPATNCADCLPTYTGQDCLADIDECLEGTHTCDSNATCSNTLGGYSCSCNIGYTGNDFMCDLITCPIGSYVAELSNREVFCLPCPDKSVTTVDGSDTCTCLQGYFRNEVEGKDFPCTRPPSACQSLELVESDKNTIRVRWERPLITGREDFYYNVYYSDPDNNGQFIKHNANKFQRKTPNLGFAISGLRPMTNYTIRVTVHNGVSDQDPGNDRLRMCEINTTSSDLRPESPRSLMSFCDVIVWESPGRAYGVITGYDINFHIPGTSQSNLVSKRPSKLFHVIQDADKPGDSGEIHVQVRTKTSFADSMWSDSIPLGCTPFDSMCP